MVCIGNRSENFYQLYRESSAGCLKGVYLFEVCFSWIICGCEFCRQTKLLTDICGELLFPACSLVVSILLGVWEFPTVSCHTHLFVLRSYKCSLPAIPSQQTILCDFLFTKSSNFVSPLTAILKCTIDNHELNVYAM